MVERNFMKMASLISVSLVVAITVSLFVAFNLFLRPTQWISLIFLLFAEVAFFGSGLYLPKMKQSFSPIVMVVYQVFLQPGYFLVTLILFFLTLLLNNIFFVLLLHFVTLGVFVVVTLIVLAFAQRIKTSDAKALQARKVMDECEKRIHLLIAGEQAKAYAKELNEIYDILCYANKMSNNHDLDIKVLEKVMRLEELFADVANLDEQQVRSALQAIKMALELRKIELAQSSRGGF